MIPYGKQSISQADIEAVVEVLRSDWITQGHHGAPVRGNSSQLLRWRHW
jgi:dTDP-4-amino-4,6-dideoxygalactose transaminase